MLIIFCRKWLKRISTFGKLLLLWRANLQIKFSLFGEGMSVSDDKGSDLGVEVDALKAQLGEYEHSLVKQSLLLEEKDAEIEKLKQVNKKDPTFCVGYFLL